MRHWVLFVWSDQSWLQIVTERLHTLLQQARALETKITVFVFDRTGLSHFDPDRETICPVVRWNKFDLKKTAQVPSTIVETDGEDHEDDDDESVEFEQETEIPAEIAKEREEWMEILLGATDSERIQPEPAKPLTKTSRSLLSYASLSSEYLESHVLQTMQAFLEFLRSVYHWDNADFMFLGPTAEWDVEDWLKLKLALPRTRTCVFSLSSIHRRNHPRVFLDLVIVDAFDELFFLYDMACVTTAWCLHTDRSLLVQDTPSGGPNLKDWIESVGVEMPSYWRVDRDKINAVDLHSIPAFSVPSQMEYRVTDAAASPDDVAETSVRVRKNETIALFAKQTREIWCKDCSLAQTLEQVERLGPLGISYYLQSLTSLDVSPLEWYMGYCVYLPVPMAFAFDAYAESLPRETPRMYVCSFGEIDPMLQLGEEIWCGKDPNRIKYEFEYKERERKLARRARKTKKGKRSKRRGTSVSGKSSAITGLSASSELSVDTKSVMSDSTFASSVVSGSTTMSVFERNEASVIRVWNDAMIRDIVIDDVTVEKTNVSENPCELIDGRRLVLPFLRSDAYSIRMSRWIGLMAIALIRQLGVDWDDTYQSLTLSLLFGAWKHVRRNEILSTQCTDKDEDGFSALDRLTIALEVSCPMEYATRANLDRDADNEFVSLVMCTFVRKELITSFRLMQSKLVEQIVAHVRRNPLTESDVTRELLEETPWIESLVMDLKARTGKSELAMIEFASLYHRLIDHVLEQMIVYLCKTLYPLPGEDVAESIREQMFIEYMVGELPLELKRVSETLPIEDYFSVVKDDAFFDTLRASSHKTWLTNSKSVYSLEEREHWSALTGGMVDRWLSEDNVFDET